MKSRHRPEDLRRWNLAATVLIGLYAVNLVLFAAAMIAPDRIVAAGLGEYTRSRSWWPILLQVVLGLAAFVCYYRPRMRTSRNFSALATGVLAVTTIVLGLIAYATCPSTSQQSPVWTPLTFALNLIGGNVAECEPGVSTFPPALQLTRLLGPLLVVIAALGIVTSVFRNAYDRIRVRYATGLVLLVGLTDDALPLLRRLSVDREPRTTLVVLVGDAGHPSIKTARDLGARVVVVDRGQTETLRSLLTSGSAFKVRSCYAVSADVADNLRWAAEVKAVADMVKPSRADMPPRMVVRIDDPWQAEYWRRTNAYRTGTGRGPAVRWMADALSVYEVTASILLDRVHFPADGEHFDRLVVVGHSPLALALCAELVQRDREAQALGATLRPGLGDLLLFGPEAATLLEQHRLRQERFGNSAGMIAVDTAESTAPHLQTALAAAKRPALVLADDPAVRGSALATYLAVVHPDWTIFDWSPGTRGVADEATMERLYPFGLTTEAPVSLPMDSWERAARIVHERYRHELQRRGTLDPEQPAHQPWEQLDAFRKETNIRQVATALTTAEQLGRSWGPVTELRTAVAEPGLSDAELETMTRAEHESWRRHHLDNGWRYGPVRDDARRIHPALLPFDQLGEDDLSKTRGGVESALATLETLGYRSR